MQNLKGAPVSERLKALKDLRRFTSSADEDGITAAISNGLIAVLSFYVAAHLGTPLHPALTTIAAGTVNPDGTPVVPVGDEERLEAVWCCTNIAAGTHEQTMMVVRAVSLSLIALLHSPNALLADHAAWALGNCAADSQEARDVLLGQGIVAPLVGLLASRSKQLAFTSSWALANLLKGPFTKAKPFLDAGIVPALMRWIGQITTFPTFATATAPAPTTDSASLFRSAELITECMWVVSYLTDKDEAAGRAFIQAGAVAACASVLLHGSLRSITPCLRVLGNLLATGDDTVTDLVCDPTKCPRLLEALAIVATPNPYPTASSSSGGAGAGGASSSSPRRKRVDSTGSSGGGFGGAGSPEMSSPSLGGAGGAGGSGVGGAESPTLIGGGLPAASVLHIEYDADHYYSASAATPSSAIAAVAEDGSTSADGVADGAAPRFDSLASLLQLQQQQDLAFQQNPYSSSVAPPLQLRFTTGHIKEALFVLSNIAGGRPRHAIALLSATLPAQQVLQPCLQVLSSKAYRGHIRKKTQAGLGFMPLFAAHALGTWQIKKLASWCLFNIANQSFNATVAPGTTVVPPDMSPFTAEHLAYARITPEMVNPPTSNPGAPQWWSHRYPLLGAVLSFPQVFSLFVGQHLQAPDLELVRLGLAFCDLVMYNWRPSPKISLQLSPFAPIGAPVSPTEKASSASAAAAAAHAASSLLLGAGAHPSQMQLLTAGTPPPTPSAAAAMMAAAGAGAGGSAVPQAATTGFTAAGGGPSSNPAIPLPASVLDLGPHEWRIADWMPWEAATVRDFTDGVSSRGGFSLDNPLSSSSGSPQSSSASLWAWASPREGFDAALDCSRIFTVFRDQSGAEIVAEEAGVEALEYARDHTCEYFGGGGGAGGMDGSGGEGSGVESGDSATADDDSLRGSAAAQAYRAKKHLGRWANHLLNTFFGEEDGYGEQEEEEEDHYGQRFGEEGDDAFFGDNGEGSVPASRKEAAAAHGAFNLGLPPSSSSSGFGSFGQSAAPAVNAAGHFTFGGGAFGGAPAVQHPPFPPSTNPSPAAAFAPSATAVAAGTGAGYPPLAAGLASAAASLAAGETPQLQPAPLARGRANILPAWMTAQQQQQPQQ